MRKRVTVLAAAGLLAAATSEAQTAWTLENVLDVARRQAPAIVSARLAVAETRGRLVGASLRAQSNPEIDVSVGPRDAGSERYADLQIGVSQLFEPPGRRMVRRESATALVAKSETEVESTVRGVLLDAAVLFYQAVYAGERVRLLAASVELTRSIADVTDRRYRAGDLAILDVHVASAALARAQADHQAALAEQTTALGQLRALLNVSEPLTVQGSLAPVSPPDMAMLTAMVEERADIRALQATIRSAEADLALARTLSKPDYGFGMRVSREGPDRLVLGGATISWPVFSKGQEQVATGLARLGRLRAELDAARARARIELQASLDAYAQRRAAALMLDDTALPGLEDVAALTTRSFDVGQIGIADVLVMRRELNETQLQALAARLEVAKARVTVDAMAGVLR